MINKMLLLHKSDMMIVNFPHIARRALMISLIGTALIFAFSTAVSAQDDDKTAEAVKEFQSGQDEHEKGNLSAAIEHYKKAIELLPEFPEAQLQLGTAFLALKDHLNAEAAFRKANDLRENWSLAMTSLGSLLVTLGKYDEAEPLLTDAIEQDGDNPLALSALAQLKLRKGADNSKLKELLDKIAALSQKNGRPNLLLLSAKAALEQHLGMRDSAAASAAQALALDPGDRTALAVAGDAALRSGDADRADNYVRTLAAKDPDNEETVILRARVAAAKGKRQEAVDILSSLRSPSASAAEYLARLKDPAAADLNSLEKRAEKDPNDIEALTGLCIGLRVSKPLQAMEYCKRAAAIEPKEMSHAVNFGAAMVQARQYAPAIELFKKLLTIRPENATIHANLATALFQLKRYPEAKEEFLWLTKDQPASPIAYFFLGIIHDQLEEYMDAMANYQQFLKLADADGNKLEIEKVNLRLPVLQRQIKEGKGKKEK